VNDEQDDIEQMRSVALRNANSVLVARQRAQQELLEARDELRRAKTRMEKMLESLTDGFCAVDLAWRITYINGRALALLSAMHKRRDDLMGQPIFDVFPELRGSTMETECRRAMAVQQTVSFEFFYPQLGCWFDLRAYPSAEGLTMYFQDITQRKADEQALLDGSNRLQVALSAGRLGDWRWDTATDRLTLGVRAAEIFGLTPETPMPWAALRERLHDGDKEMARTEFLQAFAQHTDLNIECRVDHPSGALCWIGVVGRVDYDRDGNVLGMTGVVQDISTRKSAEDTLRESEEVLRALANSIPQLAWMAQADGAIVWFNKRWYEYTGTTPVVQQTLVRVHRDHPGTGGGLGLAVNARPGSAAADAAALARIYPHRQPVRDGIPDPRRRRPVPLVPDARERGARPPRPRGALVRHQHRRRPGQAR
jgi:PAS domain S-box-containing protein